MVCEKVKRGSGSFEGSIRGDTYNVGLVLVYRAHHASTGTVFSINSIVHASQVAVN